jgi:hypothetical protein
MPNTNSPFGLKLRADLTGNQPSIRTYFVPSSDATAVFVGDLVKLAGSADGTGVATVIQAAAGDACIGVVTGIDQVKSVADANFSLYRLHRPASVGMYVSVCDDPMAVFEIQENNGGSGTAVTDVGNNANFIVGSGDTVTGLSGMQLNAATIATTATLPLKIMGFVQRPDNEISANGKLLVKINNHQLGSHTGTVGV